MDLHIVIPDLSSTFLEQLPLVAILFASLWGTFFLNKLLLGNLNRLGLYPRTIRGLLGIFTSPFLHGSLSHLIFNSLPLFILINFILFQGRHAFFEISLVIIILTGGATWLFGRKAYHIGASGVIMGYFSYLLVNAYQHPTVLTIVLAGVCLYYFAGLFAYLIPSNQKVSWEAHIFGFLSGIAANFIIASGWLASLLHYQLP